MKKVILVVLLCYAGCCYGNPIHQLYKRQFSNDSLIVGGRPIDIRELPFMGHLNISVGDEFVICGSTILTQDALLTAGHCLLNKPQIITISLASPNPKRGVYYSTSAYVIHPSLRFPQLDYDIGLVKRKGLILDGIVATTVKLPKENDILAAKTLVTVAGWGKINEGLITLSDALMEVKMPVLSLEECKRVVKHEEITERMFCAGELKEGAKSICFGDSGGPAIINKDTQVGVISGTNHCGNDGQPSTYTLVASLRAWVAKEARIKH